MMLWVFCGPGHGGVQVAPSSLTKCEIRLLCALRVVHSQYESLRLRVALPRIVSERELGLVFGRGVVGLVV